MNHLADLLTGGLAQIVSLGHGVSGNFGRHAHHVFLVHHQAVGLTEHVFKVDVVVNDLLSTVLTVGVFVVRLLPHGTRSIESHEGGDIFERSGRQSTHQVSHIGTFELEEAH